MLYNKCNFLVYLIIQLCIYNIKRVCLQYFIKLFKHYQFYFLKNRYKKSVMSPKIGYKFHLFKAIQVGRSGISNFFYLQKVLVNMLYPCIQPDRKQNVFTSEQKINGTFILKHGSYITIQIFLNCEKSIKKNSMKKGLPQQYQPSQLIHVSVYRTFILDVKKSKMLRIIVVLQSFIKSVPAISKGH